MAKRLNFPRHLLLSMALLSAEDDVLLSMEKVADRSDFVFKRMLLDLAIGNNFTSADFLFFSFFPFSLFRSCFFLLCVRLAFLVHSTIGHDAI